MPAIDAASDNSAIGNSRMKTAAVLGSVVLKKAFDFLDKQAIKPVLYAPKLSLAALNDRSTLISVEQLADSGLDAFTHGVVARDFGKTFLRELSDLSPDYLLIDLLDDFADLLVNPTNGGVITKTNYLSMLNLQDYDLDGWQTIPRNSETGWSLWERGCETLAQNIPDSTQIVLVRIFQPEKYVEKMEYQAYSPQLLERVQRNNATLERAYQILSEHLRCLVLDVPVEVIVSQTKESKGFNPTDLGELAHSQIARAIASAIHLEASIIPSLENRMDQLFDLFGSVLQQDVPTISELHTMGRRYLERGDVDKARWAERLIVLLKNSSVPLSVQMGKASFGYGGIGIVVHADCKIGDFVNIGSNVTLGGGSAQRVDADGKRRRVPHIGNRVYIATGAKLLGGITVGDHSIIGANAVVTHDVPPLSVVAGNPAKIITSITPENLSKYASYLYKSIPVKQVERLIFGR